MHPLDDPTLDDLPLARLLARRRALSRLSRLASAWALHSLFATPAAAQGGRASQVLDSARALGGVGADTPFTLGVASGEPRESSVLLWTRLAPRPLQADGGLPPQPVRVRWELAADAAFARIVRRGDTLAWPQHAHSVHVDVAGLEPARVYHYRFICAGHASPVGRTRTAPAPDAAVQRLRIALACCQHYEQGYYAVHREIAQRDADLVIFTGDYIYETDLASDHRVRQHGTPSPYNLTDYRLRYGNYKLDADLQALHAAHPWVLTWDDHEVENDYTGIHSAFDRSDADFLRLRAAAYKAYFEHMPLSPRRLPAGMQPQHSDPASAAALAAANGLPAMRLHDRFAWGRLADLITVDTRQFRSRHACDTHRGGGSLWRCDELSDPQRTVLGAEQEAWLASGLASSLATWKILTQSQQISSYGLWAPFARPASHPGGWSGRMIHSDGWDGYPAARERLLHAIHEPRVSNVICLGGDAHRSVAAPLRLRPNDAHSPIVASEFLGSSMTSAGMSPWQCATLRRMNPDLLHMRTDERGYAWLDITPAQTRCDLRTTAHPVQRDASLHTQASFVVEAGRAGPQQA